jgi:hypothetical protein
MMKTTSGALTRAALIALSVLVAPGLALAQIPLGPEFRVDDTGETFTYQSDRNTSRTVTVAPDGRFVVAWFSDASGGPDIAARRFSARGTP